METLSPMAMDIEMESPRGQSEELLTQQEAGLTDAHACALTLHTWVSYLGNTNACSSCSMRDFIVLFLLVLNEHTSTCIQGILVVLIGCWVSMIQGKSERVRPIALFEINSRDIGRNQCAHFKLITILTVLTHCDTHFSLSTTVLPTVSRVLTLQSPQVKVFPLFRHLNASTFKSTLNYY